MDASVSGRVAAFLCLATVIAARVVSAQAAPIGVELHYEAFAGCPEREAFSKNLEARQRGAVAGAVQLDVRLRELAADGVEGSITVSSANGVSARRIMASTCSEAADALALIAALALQGIEVEEVPATDSDEPSTGKRKDRRADKTRASDADPTSQTPSEASVAAETEPTAATPTAAESTIETASPDESTVIDAVQKTTSEDDEPIEPEAERTTHAYVLLSGGVASGVLPHVQPFPELALGLEQGPPGTFFWSVHAAFRISPNQTRHVDQGVVTFGWWTGLSAVCLGVRASQLSASGCAVIEVGLLSASGTDTESPRSERRAWVALGPGLTFGYDVTPALRLSLRAELLTPLTRYRLELPRETAVHEPSALGLRAGLGVGLYLE
jgi:hypothetical protein